MRKEDLREDLRPYYDKADCCSLIVELRKEKTELEQENKQLQEELKCTIGIVEHNRIISEKNKEIHQLKKQLEKALNDYCRLDAYNETQQKDFIKWLEDYLKLFDTMDIEEQASYDTIEEILQKYKEIIGGNK